MGNEDMTQGRIQEDHLHHSKEAAQETDHVAVRSILQMGEPATVRLADGASTIISPVDTLFIPHDFTDDQILELLVTSLEMRPLEYTALDKLLQNAKAFYRNFLRMGIPLEIEKMKVENKAGLLKFVSKAKLKRERREFKFVSPFGPTVCALLKVASAYSQLGRKSYADYRSLDSAISKKIRDQMDFVEGVDGVGHQYGEFDIRDRKYDRPRTITAERLSPGDLENMFLTKMLSDPSYDAKTKLMEGPVEYEYVDTPEDIYSLVLLHCETINRKNPLPPVTFSIGSSILSDPLKKKLMGALAKKSIRYRFTDLKNEQVERCTLEFEMGIAEYDGAPHRETKRKITFDFQLKNGKNLASNRYVNQAQNMLEAVCRLHGTIGPTYLNKIVERVMTLTGEKKAKVELAIMKGYVPLGFPQKKDIQMAMDRDDWHPRYITKDYAIRLAGQGLLAEQANRMAMETRQKLISQIQKRK